MMLKTFQTLGALTTENQAGWLPCVMCSTTITSDTSEFDVADDAMFVSTDTSDVSDFAGTDDAV